eukprot:jgi/Mesen1/3853/ME000207S02866
MSTHGDPQKASAKSDLQTALEEARQRLEGLSPRPSVEAYERAQLALAAIDHRLVNSLETIMAAAPLEGVNGQLFASVQAKKRQQAEAEAEAERRPHVAVVELESKHRHLEDVIQRAELALVGVSSDAEARRARRAAMELKVSQDIQRALESRATELDLSNRGLTFLPESFGQLEHLLKLNLSNNSLEMLPDSVAGLFNLEELQLQHNQLPRPPSPPAAPPPPPPPPPPLAAAAAVDIPVFRCGWGWGGGARSALEELDLTFNNLTSLPQSCGRAWGSLRRLSLGYNKLKVLPEPVGDLTRLAHLDVRFNHLGALPASLGRLHALEHLDVSNNFASLQELPAAAIGGLSSLQVLVLSNNQLEVLPGELSQLARLHTLELDGNPWKDPPLELVEKKDLAMLKAYLAERLRQASAGGQGGGLLDWSSWLGSWKFANWLGTLMSGLNLPQLMGAAQRPASDMELGRVRSRGENPQQTLLTDG